MPLPDPYANEKTVELDPERVKLLNEAKDAIRRWTEFYSKLKKELMDELGDAHAGTIDGEKVIYYRPKDQWAVSTLKRDYPDLVEHFMRTETVEVLDLEAFRAKHPNVAERYRVRAFVERAM